MKINTNSYQQTLIGCLRSARFWFFIFIGLALWQGYYITRDSVDVPFLDEWETLRSGALGYPLNWSWLIGFHNEHRMLWTKLQIFIHWIIDGWNLRHIIIENYIIYLGMIGFVYQDIKKDFPYLSRALLWFFLCFSLSTLPVENHALGFQSNVHFSLFFFLLGVQQLFRQNIKLRPLLLGSLSLVSSAFALSSGVIFALVTMTLWCITYVLKNQTNKKNMLIVISIISMGIIFWFYGYQKPDYHPALVWPTTWLFYAFFLNLMSLQLGYEIVSVWLGIIAFFCLFISIVYVFYKRAKTLSFAHAKWVTIALSILAMNASIAMSRAGFNDIKYAKLSRYAEPGFLLVLVLFIFISELQSLHVRLGRYLLSFTIIFLLIGHIDNWRYVIYTRIFSKRQQSLTCVMTHLKEPNETQAICPVYPGDIKPMLKQAQSLNVSFTR